MTGPQAEPDPRDSQAPSSEAAAEPSAAALTPAAEAQVRRLLAEARHVEPTPPDVVARLDGVLAGLLADDAAAGRTSAADVEPAPSAPEPAHVVPLDSRRRRARRLLLVAAAVVVAGVGFGRLVAEAPTADNADTSAAGEAEDGRAAAREAPEAAADGARVSGQRDFADADPVPIGSDSFAADVSDLVVAQTAAGGPAALSLDAAGDRGGGRSEDRDDATAWFECTPADWGAGRLVPVLYDGDPAVLAFRPRTGETRIVELLQCGSGEVLRSLTLASR